MTILTLSFEIFVKSIEKMRSRIDIIEIFWNQMQNFENILIPDVEINHK